MKRPEARRVRGTAHRRLPHLRLEDRAVDVIRRSPAPLQRLTKLGMLGGPVPDRALVHPEMRPKVRRGCAAPAQAFGLGGKPFPVQDQAPSLRSFLDFTRSIHGVNLAIGLL